MVFGSKAELGYRTMRSVETVLKVCGLGRYADAIVGTLGVEHRRRTTIGVELAAKVSTAILQFSLSNGDALQAQITPLLGRAYLWS